MGTVWSVVIATETGVRNVPPIYRRAALTMGSKRLHMWLKVILPAALPFIVSGMKQGWAFAWRSLMAAEIFVTILTGFGLGPTSPLRTRTERHGAGHRNHDRYRRHRFACRQNLLFANRKISPSALGHERGMIFGHKRAPISVQREVRITNKLGIACAASCPVRQTRPELSDRKSGSSKKANDMRLPASSTFFVRTSIAALLPHSKHMESMQKRLLSDLQKLLPEFHEH